MARKSKSASSESSEGTGSAPATKTDAVRAAIDAGVESPKAGVAFIKERYDIEMAPQHFSAVKSQLRKSSGVTLRVRRGRKPGRPAGSGAGANSAARGASGGEPGLLEAMEAMKPLVASLGAEKVKRIIDLLG